jgi:hypothetical protein
MPDLEDLRAYGFYAVYTVAWDGEPSMSGPPHRHGMGEFQTLERARDALRVVRGRTERAPKPNLRIERRYVTEWEEIE